MFKKSVIAVAIMALSSIALANGSAYVGIGTGVATNTSSNSNGSVGFFRGFPANVLIGYSTVIDPDIYAAIEMNANLGTAEIENKNQMKTSHGYGISFLPGIMLGEHSVAFAKLGIVNTRFVSPNKSATGTQLGFGMQSSFTQNIELRAEYVFSAYGDVGNIKSPRQDLALATIVYRFD